MTEVEELKATTHKRLNVGCGRYPMFYYRNLDADPDTEADIHATVPPIPLPDESLSEVWACHFLEHLDYEQAGEFVDECWRVLEPGGRLGLVVPDTREVLRRWMEGAIDHIEIEIGRWYRVADLDAICAMFLYSPVQRSPHKWSYELATLRRLVERHRFTYHHEIDRYRDPRLGSGQWYQCGAEWVKA